ncbi:MAG: TldD/PmbA family protein [Oscillospiraceae bacterium]|nr:TldD/PmbA family protein [Oscillospiraceae bacterium]
MLDTVVSLLKEANVCAWEVSEVRTEGWEFYFIRHRLDQNRVRQVTHLTVRVYQLTGDGAWLGSAAGEVPPTADKEETRRLISELSSRAALVRNRPYTLHRPRKAGQCGEQHRDPAEIAETFILTMQKLPETVSEDINSYEIFVADKTRRLITSEGIDVTETYPDSMIEVVVNARKDGREIELYRNYCGGTCDTEGLRRDLLRSLRYGRDRLSTVPTPKLGAADVLFSTADAVNIYQYFADRLNTSLIYRKLSDWKIGEPICTDFRGDRLNLSAVSELPNSSRNRIFDAEGAVIRDTPLLENGIARNYLGARMFSYYLGLEDAFIPSNYAVSGGSHSADGLRERAGLEVVEFSDFQVDSMTGDLFGEIRLAYWRDGERLVPVSGGSISGSMLDLAGTMLLSAETVQYNNWTVPEATLLRGVTVTGVK